MKKCYFDAIRGGSKTTTLRFWRRPRVKAGSLHLVPGLGRVRVTSAEVVRIEDLGPADARADGFPSLRALRRALNSLYPSQARKDRSLYLVRFQFPASSPDPTPANPPVPAAPCAPARKRRAGDPKAMLPPETRQSNK